MQQSQRQLDTPFSNGKFYVLPKHLPGRLNTDDFVFFHFPSNINPIDYKVAIDSLDTSTAHIKVAGQLQEMVELPHVQYGAYADIFVLPSVNPNLPSFKARLSRGSTYIIPDVSKTHKYGQVHTMERKGVLTSGSQ